MRHASFFSGVGGLDLGFERAGITTTSVSEIDSYSSAVLAKRFPRALNLGDITKINADSIPDADIWSGGFPCQDLSSAGKRSGWNGNRSMLAFSFINLVEQRKPKWVVLENVPGLLKSNGGKDFERLANEMDQCGYGLAWRVLNAQAFGVAQRRRRVFIVAAFNSVRRAAAVLLERESGAGYFAQSAPPQYEIAEAFDRSVEREHAAQLHAAQAYARRDGSSHELASGLDANLIISFPSNYSRQSAHFNNVADPLTIAAGPPAVLYDAAPQYAEERNELKRINSHRYKACGNGVVSSVAQWIGEGIMKVERGED